MTGNANTTEIGVTAIEKSFTEKPLVADKLRHNNSMLKIAID